MIGINHCNRLWVYYLGNAVHACNSSIKSVPWYEQRSSTIKGKNFLCHSACNILWKEELFCATKSEINDKTTKSYLNLSRISRRWIPCKAKLMVLSLLHWVFCSTCEHNNCWDLSFCQGRKQLSHEPIISWTWDCALQAVFYRQCKKLPIWEL